MFEVAIQSHFSAAHHLKGYQGTCADFHGHNWQVGVFVRGEELDETGLLADFRVLRRQVAVVLDELDHRDLNEMPPFDGQNPTSENLARYLFRELSARLNDGRCRVARVRVHETPGTEATYWE